jgi:hypothetical protein
LRVATDSPSDSRRSRRPTRRRPSSESRCAIAR